MGHRETLRTKNKVIRTTAILVFMCYILLLINITLFRITVTLWKAPFSKENIFFDTSLQAGIKRGNFIPFHSIDYYLISKQEPFAVGIVNVFGNLVLFLPFGFLLPFIWIYFRTSKTCPIAILVTSTFLETMQLILGVGWFDIDDILLNTLGGLIGFALFTQLLRLYRFTKG